ncbi:unnamed protein product [Rotaria magnacalcarata]|uniref:Uncharacterized protein n=1 Tax=Rotaria magnacalcarata TaxID=392030 RepID=A0A819LLL9_9BILA|nr:unnamed protein product [Rotaria magnacalcarata]
MLETSSNLNKPSENFQYVSKTNKIKNLNLRGRCSLNQIQLIMTLLPLLEYLKTRMNRKEIGQIIRYLLSKSNSNSKNLFFLYVSGTPKICLKELNVLIKSGSILDDYSIKFINRDFYVWW